MGLYSVRSVAVARLWLDRINRFDSVQPPSPTPTHEDTHTHTCLDERPGQVALGFEQRTIPLCLAQHDLERMHQQDDGRPGRSLLRRHLLLMCGGSGAVGCAIWRDC
jgi:hypothetical protein